jgi:hypothetical protein
MKKSFLLSRLAVIVAALSPAVVVVVNAKVTTYRATISPLTGTSFNVTGFVSIFVDPNSTSTIGYAGILEGLQKDLSAKMCNATNGCGVHIHNGAACTNTTTQGGHYYVKTDVVTVDPWINARYSSDHHGKGNLSDLLNIGTTDVEGRVFVGTFYLSKDHRLGWFIVLVYDSTVHKVFCMSSSFFLLDHPSTMCCTQSMLKMVPVLAVESLKQ